MKRDAQQKCSPFFFFFFFGRSYFVMASKTVFYFTRFYSMKCTWKDSKHKKSKCIDSINDGYQAPKNLISVGPLSYSTTLLRSRTEWLKHQV